MSDKINTVPPTYSNQNEKINPVPLEDEKEISAHYEHTQDLEDGKKPKYTANTQLDDAARLLAEAGEIEYTSQQAKRVLRKIDIYVCIPMCLTYFVQQVSPIPRISTRAQVPLYAVPILDRKLTLLAR